MRLYIHNKTPSHQYGLEFTMRLQLSSGVLPQPPVCLDPKHMMPTNFFVSVWGILGAMQ